MNDCKKTVRLRPITEQKKQKRPVPFIYSRRIIFELLSNFLCR